MSAAALEGLHGELIEALGDETLVSAGDSELDLHAGDLTFHAPHRPDLVVFATSTEDVAAVLEIADRRGVPVTAYGAGTSLEGHVIPILGGISLDLSRMQRIVRVSPGDLSATVEAGVTRNMLNRAVGPEGLFFPVDPGADATLGGMASTNAAGTTTPRYGKMRPNVLALEAVLPGGQVIRTGSRAPKTSAGYDLTGLLVGCEGTLAVITEVTVRLYGIPEHTAAARISFPTVEAACRTAAGLMAAGASVSRLELVDDWFIGAINAFKGTAYPESPHLFVEATGSRETVEADLELVNALAGENGALALTSEDDAEGRARLWSARHDANHAATAAVPGRRSRATDVCVPVSQLAEAVAFARSELARLGLVGGILGHAGDGNYHAHVMIDPADADELAASDELVERLVADALARGGTCTGEHGIGLGKTQFLAREHADLLPLMIGIKQLFDPKWILNPGKVLPAPSSPPSPPPPLPAEQGQSA